MIEKAGGISVVNHCPQCQREIYTDPDSCVMCGWVRGRKLSSAQVGAPRPQANPQISSATTTPSSTAPSSAQPDYYVAGSQNCPKCGGGLFVDPNSCALCGWKQTSAPSGPSPTPGGQGPSSPYRSAPVAPPPSAPRTTRAPPYDSKPSSQTPEPYRYAQPGAGPPGSTKFACANCENPNLQFSSDGMSRCPTCQERFRFRPHKESVRGKRKLYICSKCNNKNLQFLFDGKGNCPQCKHTFRWKSRLKGVDKWSRL